MSLNTTTERGLAVWRITLAGPARERFGPFEQTIESCVRDEWDADHLYGGAQNAWEATFPNDFEWPDDVVADWEITKITNEFTNPDGTQAFFVTVYDYGRSYGGPEEGGWWFDTGVPIKHFCCRTETEARDLADKLRAGEYAETGKASSVLGGEDYLVRIGLRPGVEFPETYPHYE